MRAHGRAARTTPARYQDVPRSGRVSASPISPAWSSRSPCWTRRASTGVRAHEAELPGHEGATGALQRLEQAYDLGDDVLLTCMACGGSELEVLAARVIFCEAHGAAIGFWYELRCPECNELHYKDDLQFRCPS